MDFLEKCTLATLCHAVVLIRMPRLPEISGVLYFREPIVWPGEARAGTSGLLRSGQMEMRPESVHA